MKMKIVTIGVLMALTSSVFADDAQTQMNGQMGQTQAAAPAAPAMPAAAMPTTANTQTANQAPQTGAMPDTATGNADDMPATPAPTSNY